MTIDTTFQPLGLTFLVGVAAIQLTQDGSILPGVATTVRVQNILTTRQYLTWGPKSSVASAGAPAAGVPVANTIGLAAGESIYLEIPSTAWFIANIAAAFECTVGKGGCGG